MRCQDASCLLNLIIYCNGRFKIGLYAGGTSYVHDANNRIANHGSSHCDGSGGCKANTGKKPMGGSANGHASDDIGREIRRDQYARSRLRVCASGRTSKDDIGWDRSSDVGQKYAVCLHVRANGDTEEGARAIAASSQRC